MGLFPSGRETCDGGSHRPFSCPGFEYPPAETFALKACQPCKAFAASSGLPHVTTKASPGRSSTVGKKAGGGRPPPRLLVPLNSLRLSRPSSSDFPEQKQDDQNNQNQAQSSGRSITPIPAVRPSGQCAEQHQNQQNDQYGP